MIDLINDMDIGWKADTCKYSKDHPKRGKNCDKSSLVQKYSVRPDQALEFGT